MKDNWSGRSNTGVVFAMNRIHAFQVNLKSLKFAGHRNSLANLFAFIAGVATGLRIKRIFNKEMPSTLNNVLLSPPFVSANHVEKKTD